MPHIIIEHSPNLKTQSTIAKMAEELHNTLSVQETIKPPAVKTRTFSGENYIIGTGIKSEFVLIRLLLLPGRSPELRQIFANALLDVLQKHVNPESCSFSVEVSEMLVYATSP